MTCRSGTALLLVFGCAFTAAPAVALPDLVPHALPGWASSIVLRATPDATTTGATDPASLAGEVANYISTGARNAGPDATAIVNFWSVSVDGVAKTFHGMGPSNAGVVASVLNTPLTVRGGLHTLSTRVDVNNVIAEVSESNNDAARQLSFTPMPLAIGAVVTRSSPPAPLGGTAGVVGTVYPNVDGVAMPAAGNTWSGVAVRPGVTDLDVSLYSPGTGIADGFRTPLITSEFAAGATEFVLRNGEVAGGDQAYDVGVSYFSGAQQDYAVEYRGEAPSPSLAADQMLWLVRFTHTPGAANARWLFRLSGPPAARLHLAVYGPSQVLVSRSDALGDATTDAAGNAYLDLALPTSGPTQHYAVVVYRDAADGGVAPVLFTYTAQPTPADLSNEQAPGLTLPVNATRNAVSLVTNPTVLDGDAPNTLMGAYLTNRGAVDAAGFLNELRLDGQLLTSVAAGVLPPGGRLEYAYGPLTVRGGRHTLALRSDVTNIVVETLESNNHFARQFVWSPTSVPIGTSVTRPMPPEPTAGWDDIPNAAPKFYNVDGVRLDLAATTNVCVGTALMPGVGSDIDLDWFAKSTGAFNGFDNPIGTSQRLGDLVDLLIHYGSNTSGVDIGARKYLGTNQAYTLQSIQAADLGTITSHFGSGSIPSGEILRAYRMVRTGGAAPIRITLENTGGGADLGMTVYRPQPGVPRDMTEVVPGGFADLTGPGGNESVVLPAASNDPIAVFIWKRSASELGKAATFNLWVDVPGLDVGIPSPPQVRFAVTHGNPVRTQARIEFALPAAAAVSLDVLDVSGRRVRTLASGEWAGGTHSLDWNGTDEQGRRLAHGAYFVRFSTGEFHRVVKLALLR